MSDRFSLAMQPPGRAPVSLMQAAADAATLASPEFARSADPAEVPIASLSDLAAVLGLGRDACEEEIGRSFMDATGYEAWLEVDRIEATLSGPEAWQVAVERALPHCRLALRRGRRGEWVRYGAELPGDLLGHFEARVLPSGEIVSRRPWRAWLAMRWAGPHDRRLRMRTGRFQAQVVVPQVRRPTGVTTQVLRIGAIGEHSLREVRPVAVSLPCRLADLERAVETVMRRSIARWQRECGIVLRPGRVTRRPVSAATISSA